MIECASIPDFMHFLGLLGDIVEQVTTKLYIVHSTTGDILWRYDPEINAFCTNIGSTL